MIGAYFQCYKNYKATRHALEAFRKAYPSSSVVLVSDNGDDFSELAKEFGAFYFFEEVSCPPSFKATESVKRQECINRWFKYLPLIKEDYFMMLEDDVFVLRKYEEPFLGAINGNCINKISKTVFSKIPFTEINDDLFYSGHGGSVFKKEIFLQSLNNDKVTNFLLNNWSELGLGPHIDFDILFSLIVILYGGNIHKLETHKDFITNYHDKIFETAHVLHQYKKFY